MGRFFRADQMPSNVQKRFSGRTVVLYRSQFEVPEGISAMVEEALGLAGLQVGPQGEINVELTNTYMNWLGAIRTEYAVRAGSYKEEGDSWEPYLAFDIIKACDRALATLDKR